MSVQERLQALLAAARRVADPSDRLGTEARRGLPALSGLSPQGVELALARALETSPGQAELDALCASVTPAPAAHVLLSANVFVAAHRAIALALAASERVFVRPSRREPLMAELLARGAPGLFQLVSKLEPRAGEHVFAYGRDETLDALARELPDGVVLHRHGAGFGVAVVEAGVAPDEVTDKLALDLALFDQRGCLSPRALVVVGGDARPYAESLANRLGELEASVPLGVLDPEELAAVTRYRDALTFSAEVLPAGRGFVSLEEGGRLVIAPVGRNCHVVSSADPLPLLAEHRRYLTTLGFAGSGSLRRRLIEALPRVRAADPGKMQTPPFDGPVDKR